MATEVKMPKLGMTMTQGKIINWLKAEGDVVSQDEPIFVVENGKVTIDVEAPAAGILLKTVVSEGDIVPVGDIVAYIGEVGEKLAEENVHSEENIQTMDETPAKSIRTIRATPAAKALAAKLGFDLAAIKDFSQKERLKRADVEAYGEMCEKAQEEMPQDIAGTQTALSQPSYVDIAPSGIRLIAADRMTANFTTVPHFYLGMKVNVSKMQQMLANARKKTSDSGDKPTFTDVLTWVTAKVIKEYPIVNSQWHEGSVRQFNSVNFGIATDTPSGLLVPVLRKAESRTFEEIVRMRSRMINAAREGRLMPDDMSGGTFTLSNLGMFGIDAFQAILNSPECALLAVGAVENEFFVNDGEIGSMPIMKMSLTCDHRVLDGAVGARFLKRLKDVMEEPAKLLDRDLF